MITTEQITIKKYIWERRAINFKKLSSSDQKGHWEFESCTVEGFDLTHLLRLINIAIYTDD